MNDLRHIVFDIETKNTFADVGAHDVRALNLSIVGIYDSHDKQYATYTEEELPLLWPRIERTSVLIGWNSNNFDIPLLDKYYPGSLLQIPSLDLMEEVRKSLGRRLKLDTVAQATLGVGKSGNGLKAIEWWQKGEIEKVREYCLQDVRVTKELFEFACTHGHVMYTEAGTKQKIPVACEQWLATRPTSPLTHTLPF